MLWCALSQRCCYVDVRLATGKGFRRVGAICILLMSAFVVRWSFRLLREAYSEYIRIEVIETISPVKTRFVLERRRLRHGKM